MDLVFGDEPDFFDKISNHIGRMGNDHVILAGDWNVILNMKLDTRNYIKKTWRIALEHG